MADGGDGKAVSAAAAAVCPSRLTDFAICVECRTTATATPSGDSETYYSYVVCDQPSACKIRSEKMLRITSHPNLLIIEYQLQLESKPLS